MDTHCPSCGIPSEPAGHEDAWAYYACPLCGRAWSIPITTRLSGEGRFANPLRVLIVDDSEQMLGLLSLLLEDEGCIVMTALSGAQAMDAVTAFTPDVAFVDLVLPPPDGWRVAARLQDVCKAEVILMTGMPSEMIRARAEEMGVTLLEKPFEEEAALHAFAAAATRIAERAAGTPGQDGDSTDEAAVPVENLRARA
jgi:DNA-binding response OmpR family regulator